MAGYVIEILCRDLPSVVRRFQAPAILIGHRTGDLKLDDPQVDDGHARLRFDGAEVIYEDLASGQDSFDASGQPIRGPHRLVIGVPVRLGGTIIMLQSIEHEPARREKIATFDLDYGEDALGAEFPRLTPGAPLARPAASGSYDVDPGSREVAAAAPRAAFSDLQADSPFSGGSRPVASPGASAPRSGGSRPVGGPPPDPSAATAARSGRNRPRTGALPPGGVRVPLPPPPSLGGDEDNPFAAKPTAGAGPRRPSAAPQPTFRTGTTGVWEDVRTAIDDGIRDLRPILIPALMTLFSLTIAGAMLDLLLGWIPYLGVLVHVGVFFSQLLIGPFAAIALLYLLLKAKAGDPVSAGRAWQIALGDVKALWPSLLIPVLVSAFAGLFLIVPGIAAGCFLMQVYVIEGRRSVDVTSRCVDYFAADYKRLTVLFLVAGIAPVLLAAGVGAVLAFGLKYLSPILATAVSTLLTAGTAGLAATVLVAVTTRWYPQLRSGMRGGDTPTEVETSTRNAIRAWEHAGGVIMENPTAPV